MNKILKILATKIFVKKIHKIDINYSYGFLEAISSIQTTWNSKDSACKPIYSSSKCS